MTGKLAEVATCSLKSAQRTLRALVLDGILEAVVPERVGKQRGNWRNVYHTAKVK